MKVLLEVKDNKVAFFMELLNNFSFVKAKPMSKKEFFLEELREAVDEVVSAKKGKVKLKSAQDLLDEL